jgi:hypothetical protein
MRKINLSLLRLCLLCIYLSSFASAGEIKLKNGDSHTFRMRMCHARAQPSLASLDCDDDDAVAYFWIDSWSSFLWNWISNGVSTQLSAHYLSMNCSVPTMSNSSAQARHLHSRQSLHGQHSSSSIKNSVQSWRLCNDTEAPLNRGAVQAKVTDARHGYGQTLYNYDALDVGGRLGGSTLLGVKRFYSIVVGRPEMPERGPVVDWSVTIRVEWDPQQSGTVLAGIILEVGFVIVLLTSLCVVVVRIALKRHERFRRAWLRICCLRCVPADAIHSTEFRDEYFPSTKASANDDDENETRRFLLQQQAGDDDDSDSGGGEPAIAAAQRKVQRVVDVPIESDNDDDDDADGVDEIDNDDEDLLFFDF